MPSRGQRCRRGARPRAYLVNTPPNLLNPQSFAEAAKKRAAASSAKVTVSVLDEKALVKGGFGGIVGVGQGSANPPRIVTMTSPRHPRPRPWRSSARASPSTPGA